MRLGFGEAIARIRTEKGIRTVKLGGKGRNVLTLGNGARSWGDVSLCSAASRDGIPHLTGKEAPAAPKRPGAQQVLASPEARSTKTLS